MNHEELKSLVTLIDDPELDEGERREIRQHLDSCPTCAEVVSSWRRHRGAFLEARNSALPSTDLVQKVMRQIPQPRREAFWWRLPAFGLAAASLLIALFLPGEETVTVERLLLADAEMGLFESILTGETVIFLEDL